ncbi:MAG: AraC family transcriptional regulator [Clostridia bacterium]
MNLTYQIDMEPESEWLIVSSQQETKENLPFVQELGDFIAHEKYFTKREGLPSYLIKYTLSGEGYLSYENQEVYLPQGHFFWIDCQNPQYYLTSPRTGNWRVLWLHFYGGASEYLYDRFIRINGGNTGRLPPNSTVVQNMYSLIGLYKQQSAQNTDLLASTLLLQIQTECITSVARDDSGVQSKYVRQAQDFINANYKRKITLDVLADFISLNKTYLQKLFVMKTGQTPNQFLVNIRISRAKELLRMTEIPVSAVAEETGIESSSYFIRIFREHEKMTPAEYRRTWRSGN